MLRKTLAVLLLTGAAGIGFKAVAVEDCGGKATLAKDTGAQSEDLVFGVEIKSEKLRKALAGFEMDESEIRCPACKKALETDGTCEHCSVSMAQGKAYRSPVAYALAKGSPMPAEPAEACPMRCEQCKTARAESGFCESCGVGFVADRMYKGKEDYEAAVAAYKILTRAVKASASCESCAVGLVTNGTCDRCSVEFKDGKLVKHDG